MAQSIFDIIAGQESGGSANPLTVVNPTNTSSGHATGLFQITTGTWAQYAPIAGVTTPQGQASAVEQAQVASVIPLNRWAPSTVAAVQAQYPGIDTSQPVGALANGNIGNVVLNDGSNVAPTIDVGGPAYDPSIEQGQQGSEYAPTGTQQTTTGAQNLGADVGYVPPAATGGPQALGLAPGVVSSVSGWISGIESAVGTAWKSSVGGVLASIENWVSRFFLVIVGVLVLLVGLWYLMDEDGTKTATLLKTMPVEV
jgi:hypothetical protein